MTDVLFVCAPGGHLTVGRELAMDILRVTFIVTTSSNEIHPESKYFVREANRDFAVFGQIFDAVKVLFKTKPRIIISTGAGVAVPFLILGKIFWGSKTIFVESASRVSTLSLAGKLVYPFVDKFYVRSAALSKVHKRATYYG